MQISFISHALPCVPKELPVRDIHGLCTSLILAAAEMDNNRCLQIVEHLFETRQPYPFVLGFAQQ